MVSGLMIKIFETDALDHQRVKLCRKPVTQPNYKKHKFLHDPTTTKTNNPSRIGPTG
jgi:hypothetical protein